MIQGYTLTMFSKVTQYILCTTREETGKRTLHSGYNHSPKHCFKGEHDINDIMEKMNINSHQSQSSGLYS